MVNIGYVGICASIVGYGLSWAAGDIASALLPLLGGFAVVSVGAGLVQDYLVRRSEL